MEIINKIKGTQTYLGTVKQTKTLEDGSILLSVLLFIYLSILKAYKFVLHESYINILFIQYIV